MRKSRGLKAQNRVIENNRYITEHLNTARFDPVIFGELSVGCHLYDDDILILSKSADGLQKAVNNLNAY